MRNSCRAWFPSSVEKTLVSVLEIELLEIRLERNQIVSVLEIRPWRKDSVVKFVCGGKRSF